MCACCPSAKAKTNKVSNKVTSCGDLEDDKVSVKGLATNNKSVNGMVDECNRNEQNG
jgi:hypothetical protein